MGDDPRLDKRHYYSGNSLAVSEITAHGTANSQVVTTGRVDVSGLGVRYTALARSTSALYGTAPVSWRSLTARVSGTSHAMSG